MGSLVLLVHDFADHWLELAKLAKYAGQEVVQYNFRCGCIFITDLLPRSLSLPLILMHILVSQSTPAATGFYIARLIFGAQVKLIDTSIFYASDNVQHCIRYIRRNLGLHKIKVKS